MNKNSILFSITLAFAALFLFIIMSFIVLIHNIEKKELFVYGKRAHDVTHIILKELRKTGKIEELKEYLDLLEFDIVKNKNEVLKNKDKRIIWKENKRNIKIIRYMLNGENYLHIKAPRFSILLLDKDTPVGFKSYIVFIFFLIVIAFIILYIRIVKKLQPLSMLKDKVQNIGNEDFEIECATDKKDEISQLANEFDKTAKRLKSIKESRNIFIRNIMHELKTPITKGQFLVQLPQTDENRESLQKVFYRLESLINEFASIEALIATKQLLNTKEYNLSDLIDNAKDILMCEDSSVDEEYEDMKLRVDFKLFSIAIKNLLDNGIKYSPDKKVTIKTENGSIVFENKGEQLRGELEEYFEPFVHTQRSNMQSFGLGLYIVKHILNANGYILDYSYALGYNRFIVKDGTIL